MALDADRPTRTLTLIRTLWGDLCLDAVVCEVSRLILSKGGCCGWGVRFSKFVHPGVPITSLK